MGRHGGRSGRRDTLKSRATFPVSRLQALPGNGGMPIPGGPVAHPAEGRPGTAVLTPPNGVLDAPVVGLNTPAGGLPDPQRWFDAPEQSFAPQSPSVPGLATSSRRASIEPQYIEPPAPQLVRPPLPEVWWDDAPVPPPVVVAAADPGLVDDPQDVTAVFTSTARPGARAPEAPRSRRERIARDSNRGWSATEPRPGDVAGPPARRRLSDDDTSELVRPYVTGPIPLAVWAGDAHGADPDADPDADPIRTHPDAGADADPDARLHATAPPWASPAGDHLRAGEAPAGAGHEGVHDGEHVVPFPTARRSTRERDVLAQRLGTHLTPPTGLTGLIGSGPRGIPTDDDGTDGAVSLFQPSGQPSADRAGDGSAGTQSPWAAPADLPSRRELRAKQRQVASTRAVTARRLAKGGVLAVTAVGVVAAGGPTVLSALGVSLNTPSTPLEQATLADAAVQAAASGGGALAGGLERATSDRLEPALAGLLHQRRAQDAAQARNAGTAAATAGRTLVQVAAEQVRLEAERKAKLAQQVSRNVIRDPRSYARMLVTQRGWSSSQFSCLNLLWNRESGWNYRAQNPSSGAYGIPQALPGSKMGTVASDWRTNPATQIKWGLNYIADRYGTPCGAWAHSERRGWY